MRTFPKGNVAGPSPGSASSTSAPTPPRPAAAASASTAPCRIASSTNCASPASPPSTPPTPTCARAGWPFLPGRRQPPAPPVAPRDAPPPHPPAPGDPSSAGGPWAMSADSARVQHEQPPRRYERIHAAGGLHATAPEKSRAVQPPGSTLTQGVLSRYPPKLQVPQPSGGGGGG